MSDFVTKGDLQEAIQEGRLAFDEILEPLSDEEMVHPLLDNGWSAKDIVLHIVSWEQRLIGWLNTAAQGDEPQIPAPGYDWDEIDALNQHTYDQQQHRSLEDIMASYRASLHLLFMVLDRLTDEDLNSQYFSAQQDVLWQFFADNTYGHYQEHAEEIEAALARR